MILDRPWPEGSIPLRLAVGDGLVCLGKAGRSRNSVFLL